jgi:hypothetical protein
MGISINSVFHAIKRCRIWIISVFIIYLLSCSTGIIMVHSGNRFALSYRDKIVGKAMNSDKASINYHAGNRFRAALIDFNGNLLYSAVPQTIAGLSIVIPYFSAIYQGWIGGIVSINNNHSRFDNLKSMLYYLIVLLLQYIPYSLAIGSGIKFGVDTYRLNKNHSILKYRIDKSHVKEVLQVYLVAVPLFFIASCFEFLSNWNI